MERHHWSVGRVEPMLDVHLQDAVLSRRIPAVGPEQVLHGIPIDTFWADDAGAECEEDCRAFDAQRVSGTGERPVLKRRPSGQIKDHSDGVRMTLERRSSCSVLEILCALAVQKADYVVATKVRRI